EVARRVPPGLQGGRRRRGRRHPQLRRRARCRRSRGDPVRRPAHRGSPVRRSLVGRPSPPLREPDRRERSAGMSAYARRTWIVLWKDLVTERRSKESLNALLFFTLLLLFLFQFSLGPDRDRLRAALPGLFWLGLVLTGLLGLGKTLVAERANDCWEGLRLTAGDKSAIYL